MWKRANTDAIVCVCFRFYAVMGLADVHPSAHSICYDQHNRSLYLSLPFPPITNINIQKARIWFRFNHHAIHCN